MKRGYRFLLAGAIGFHEVACVSGRSTPVEASGFRPPQTTREWQSARADFESLRGQLQLSVPRKVFLHVLLDAPLLGAPMTARGAYAVRPPNDLRLQLIGAMGILVLDVWVQREAFRWSMPAVPRVERGLSARALPTGHPVNFLRWWLLRPLAGTLLYSAMTPQNRFLHTVRATDGAVLTIWTGAVVTIRRQMQRQSEWISFTRQSCGEVHYRRHHPTVRVTMRCLGTAFDPSERLFTDPELPSPPSADDRKSP